MDRRHRSLFPTRLTAPALFAAVVLLGAACGDRETNATEPTLDQSTEDAPTDSTGARFPDVIAVESELDGETWTFSVTISSPYDSAERYADAWRVLGPDDTEYGIRILTHDHADEQPFTRSQRGISIPSDVDVVIVQARDLLNGWGGGTVEHELER